MGPTEGEGEVEAKEAKITQTDHLNKQLLSSFLDRLNQLDASGGFPVVERIDTADPEDDLDFEYSNRPAGTSEDSDNNIDTICPDK